MQGLPPWDGILAELVAESSEALSGGGGDGGNGVGGGGGGGGGGGQGGGGANAEGGSVAGGPPASLQRLQQSPALSNVALSLAHHRRAQQEQAQAEGVPAWVKEVTQAHVDDYADTLRTILCL